MKRAKGIRLEDARIGRGPEATKGDIVIAHVTCTLSKGDVVFTTRGSAPYQIEIGKRDCYVGLEHGVLGMKRGGRRKLKVPPHLTHHEREYFTHLPEAAVLNYEIQLIAITKRWDSFHSIRYSPAYSMRAKILARLFRVLRPSSKPRSLFQRVQSALMKAIADVESDAADTEGSEFR